MLADLLPVAHIKPKLKAKDRWQAIEELLDVLVVGGALTSELSPKALTALQTREKTMSTGIGMGIAIPHAAVEGLDKVIAAFGKSEEGMEFDSLDNAPVNLVILFLIPKNEFQTHLKTLATIARFLNREEERKSLMGADSAEKLRQVFQDNSSGTL